MTESRFNTTLSHISGGNMTGDSTDNNSLVTEALQVILSIMVYIGNILIIIVTPRLKRVKSTTRYLILHLAVSDLLVAVGISIRFVLTYIKYEYNEKTVCLVVMALLSVSCGNSITGIMYLTFDIYVSIRASKYPSIIMSRRFTALLISTSWIFWTIMIGLQFVVTPEHDDSRLGAEIQCQLGNEYYPWWFGFLVSFPATIQYFITAFIVIRALRSLKHLTDKMNVTSSNIFYIRNSNNEIQDQIRINVWPLPSNQTISFVKLRRFQAMTRLAVLILTTFGICWLPLLVSISIKSIFPSTFPIVNRVQKFIAIPALFQSVMNVVIYYYKSTEFQKGVKDLYHKRRNVQITTIGSSRSHKEPTTAITVESIT